MTGRRHLLRLATMSPRELVWRSRAAGRIAIDRMGTSMAPPLWNRGALVSQLAPLPELAPMHDALEAGRWEDAHAAFGRFLVESPQRFVIGPRSRETFTAGIGRIFGDGVRDVRASSARLMAGEYDLLGYEGLRFPLADGANPAEAGSHACGGIDWHLDPVNNRRAPLKFWADVPYLDPDCGDHKIIWELNRHQHWLALGRAFWLTGDERYRTRALDELGSWLHANPPLTGINWTSMLELAFRALSWVWALSFFVDPTREGERPWSIDLLMALDRQLEHIERNLSYYFSPNTHLLGEALALYVTARALPVLRGSARREALGRAILCGEIDRQISTDGGHCERSTHYHRYTLDFYLLGLAVARIGNDTAAIPFFEDAVGRLASAARLLADDQGRLPHFGDDDGGSTMPIVPRSPHDASGSLSAASVLLDRPDLGVGAPPEEVFWLLAHPIFTAGLETASTRTSWHTARSGALERTGYYVSRSASGHHLVLDGGPHGYQNGGHAHADALSLTLALDGLPFLIDPGTGSYTANPELRDRFRSSAAHNTLTLDARSQSIPSGPFHWKGTANAQVRRWRAQDEFDYFEAAHDGYRPLEHRRHVLMQPGDLLVVADLVAGAGTHRADVHWHIDPCWRTEVFGRRAIFTLVADPNRRVELMVPHGSLELFAADDDTGLGWYSPVYGRVEPSATVRLSLSAAAPFWLVSVFALDPSDEVVEVAIDAGPDAGHGISVRLERSRAVDHLHLGGGPSARVTSWREYSNERRRVAG